MRITAPVVALLLLTACGGDGGSAASPSPSSPVASSPTTSSPPASTSSCPAVPALPAGATLVAATVTGTTVTTAHGTWTVAVGSQVRVAVTADRADEVHVHTYDKKAGTVPGCPTAIDLVANVPGSVEVELEGARLHLFDLKAS